MAWTTDVDSDSWGSLPDLPRVSMSPSWDARDGTAIVDCVIDLLTDSDEPALLLTADGDVRWANGAFWALPAVDRTLGCAALVSALSPRARAGLGRALTGLRADNCSRRVAVTFDRCALPDMELSLTSLARAGSQLVAARVLGAPATGGPADREFAMEFALLQIRSELRALRDDRLDPAAGLGNQRSIPLPADLPARQRDVATLILEGRSIDEIARRLTLSPHTVRNHLKAVFRRTGVHSRAAFVARYHA